MSQTVIGIFDNASEAQEAVEQLVKEGFDRSAIDVSTSGSSNTSYSSTGSGSTSSQYDNNEGESKIGKFFRSLFGGDDDDNDTRYSNYSKVAEGRSIVTVHAKSADEADDAADILDEYGAINIDDDAKYGAASMSADTQSGQSTGETTSIPVIEEQLQVGKKTVETGGVRLRSRIVERPVEESLRLREERVYVDRTAVNRPVTGSELESFKEGTIELTETAEVPVVAKEAYVKEEVRLGKEVSERDETIRDTVRSTEVDVENLKTDTDVTDSTRTSYGTSGSSNTTGNL